MALDESTWRETESSRDGPQGDLEVFVGDVLRAMNARDNAEAEYEYRMARLARLCNARQAAGRSAMELCSAALNISRQTLQKYVSLTARWTPERIREILLMTDGEGRRVTISHLFAIARAPSSLRSRLIERVFHDRIDVRKLRVLLGCAALDG